MRACLSLTPGPGQLICYSLQSRGSILDSLESVLLTPTPCTASSIVLLLSSQCFSLKDAWTTSKNHINVLSISLCVNSCMNPIVLAWYLKPEISLNLLLNLSTHWMWIFSPFPPFLSHYHHLKSDSELLPSHWSHISVHYQLPHMALQAPSGNNTLVVTYSTSEAHT